MGWEEIAIVWLGGLAGGLVSGLAGFGTGISAMGIWLYVLSPTVAATLVIVCSVAAQVQTLPKIWSTVEPRRVLPMIVPGLFGVPLGTILLAWIDVSVFKLVMGALLLIYALHGLLSRSGTGTDWGGRPADGVIGFGGGILGGLAGLSGPLPTIWADIRGWTKAERRSAFQTFNLAILSAALMAHWTAGLITEALVVAVMAALPGTFIGAWIGAALYARLSDTRFREIILVLLFTSGVGLIWSNL